MKDLTMLMLHIGIFSQKILKVIDEVPPWKTTRVKNNTPEQFDQDIYHKIKIGSMAFKNSRKVSYIQTMIFIDRLEILLFKL